MASAQGEAFQLKTRSINYVELIICGLGSRDGALVRALAFHQCGPGSIPGPGVICGLSLLLVLVLAPRVFLRVRFSSLHKNQHFQIPVPPACKAHLITFI